MLREVCAGICGLVICTTVALGQYPSLSLEGIGLQEWHGTRAIAVNDAGTVVGTGRLYWPGHEDRTDDQYVRGTAGVIFRAGALSQLPSFGTASDGRFDSSLTAINASEVAYGGASVYNSNGDYVANYALRWTSGQAALLPTLGDGAMPPVLTRIASEAWDIDSYDTIVGHAYKFSSSGVLQGWRPTRWDAGQPTQLDTVYAGIEREGSARAINDSGLIIGSFEVGGRDYACAWNGNQFVPLGSTQPGGANRLGPSSAIALSESGVVVGWGQVYDSDGTLLTGTYGFAWQNGTLTELPALRASTTGKFQALPRTVNTSGLIGGSSRKVEADGTDRGVRGVLWQNGAIVAEIDALGTDTSGRGLSEVDLVDEKGWAVGSAEKYDDQGQYRGRRAFVWIEGETTFFDFPALARTDGYGWSDVIINDHWNFAVVQAQRFEGKDYAGIESYLWKPGTEMVLLRDVINGGLLPGEWESLALMSISPDGSYIVGNAINAEGQVEGVLITVPEPGAISLAMLGGLLLGMRQRRPSGRSYSCA